MDISKLNTEGQNAQSVGIDKMSALEIATCINEQDKTVAYAVEKCLNSVAEGIESLAAALNNGGRIFYVGAGTSGRLGVLDASECPPTYGVSPELVQGLIAGGKEAAFRSVESAEDNENEFIDLLKSKKFCAKDALVGISASGSAACVQGAMKYARENGATTLCISCNINSPLIALSDIPIIAVTGAEVISGSTRMKAGTATKMILNMLSTGAMIRIGRVRGNTMAYMKPSNQKLVRRAIVMITQKTGVDDVTAEIELKKADYIVADAIDNIIKSKR